MRTESTTRLTDTLCTQAIADALHHDATVDAENITVVCAGADIFLSGFVQSWAALRSAERAAWAMQGVRCVHNYIQVHVPHLGESP